MKPALSNNSIKIWLLIAGIFFSSLLGYFVVQNYRSALPVAEENLLSLAFSLAETIESLVSKDPSLELLREVKSPDVAFFSVINSDGIQLFHTNPELIGTHVEEEHLTKDITGTGFREQRIVLGTGESVFELVTPLHLTGRTLGLRLVLHAYRSDAIVRRARTGLVVVFSLLAMSWLMGIALYRYAMRAERHQLEMAERENLARLGTMGAVLAHEVRNPLSGIKGYAQLLDERLPDLESREYAGFIVTEAVRLEELVNDLLAFARTEPEELIKLPLGEIISRSIALVEPMATQYSITIVRDIDAHLSAYINCNRLEQVFLNLLQNAIQSMPNGGTLTVGAKREGSRIRITICDTGQGIAPSDLERIFDPFFTTKARGSGLGLAISKKFVEEMKGTIRVISEPAQGSSFQILLPAAA